MKKQINELNKFGIGILIGIFFSIVLMPSANADYLPHKQNIDFDLLISSNNATSCNFTYIQFPDGTKQQWNFPMTRTGTEFNYSIEGANFSLLGSTCFGVSCYDGTNYETGSVCREITPTGFSGTLGFYILILIVSAGVIVLGFSKNDAPIVILGSFGLYFIGLYILLYGIVGIRDIIYTRALAFIVLALAAYISIKSSYELIVD